MTVLVTSASVPAATMTWTGGGGNNNWTTAGNWGGTAPVAGDDLVFGSVGAARTTNTNDFAAGTSFNSITFNVNSNYTISGNQIALGAGGISVTSGTQSLSTPLAFAATRAVTVTAGTLTLGGVISGAGGLTKTGAGTLTLSGGGANTYTGATAIDAGTLVAAKNGALGTVAGNTTVASGATLGFQGGINYATAEPVQMAGTGVLNNGAIRNVSGNNSFVGPITQSAPSTIGSSTAGNTLTLSGGITGATYGVTFTGAGNITESGVVATTTGTLTKTGTGTLTLSNAANTYTGQTTINQGTVSATTLANGGNPSSLGSSAAVTPILIGSATAATLSYTGGTASTDRQVTVNGAGGGTVQATNGAGTLTLSGDISNGGNLLTLAANTGNITVSAVISGAGGLTKTGTGTLTLSNAANTYTGQTTINRGTVSVGTLANGGANSSLGATAAATPIRIGSATAATLSYTGGTVSTDRQITIAGAGGGTVQATSGAATLTLSGAISNGGNLLTLATNTGNITVSSVISGTGGLTKTGTGTLTLSAASTYTGATAVNAGTLLVDGSVTSSVTVGNGDTLGGVGTVGPVGTASTVSVAAGGTLSPGDGGPGRLSAGGNVTFTNNTSVFRVELNGTAAGTGYDQLSVAAGRTAALNSATLNATLGFTPDPGASFVILDVAFGTGSAVTGTFNGLPQGSTLTIGSSNFRVVYGATNVVLTCVGTNSFIWNGGGGNDNWTTGANWMGGAAPLGNSGEDLIFAGATRPTPNSNFAAGTTFNSVTFNTNASFTVGGNAIVLGGASALSNAAGLNTLNTDITFSHATPRITSAAGYSLTAGGALGNSIAGGVTKEGAGTLTFSGASANSYTGATVVNDGRLDLSKTAGVNAIAGALTVGDGAGAAGSAIVRLVNANQIADASAVAIQGDGLLNLNGNSEQIATLSMTGGSVTTGAGTLTLGGDVTGNPSAATATISGNLSLGGATRTFTIADGAAAADLNVLAVITNGALVKAGPGLLMLSAVNTYGGSTTVNAGALKLGRAPGAGPSGPVAYYPFDGDADDATGNGHDGTLVGGPTYVAGRSGQALSFNGTQEVNISYDGALGLNTFTASAWVNLTAKPLDPTAGSGVMGTRNAAGADNTFDFKVQPALVHGDIGTGSAWISIAVDFPSDYTTLLNSWHMLTYVVDNTAHEYRLYLDGNRQVQVSFVGTPLFMTPTQVFHIGSCGDGLPNEGMVGLMDDVYVYDRALTDDEVAALCGGGGSGGGGSLPPTTAVVISNGATLDLNGCSQTIASLADGVGGGGSVVNSAADTLTLTLDSAAGSTSFSGVIAGSGASAISVVKNGASTQILAGVNTYSGSTTVNAGTLLVGSGGSLSTGAVTVNSGGTLGGYGTVGGPVTVASGGWLSPGASAGWLTTGNLTFGNGSNALFELGAASPTSSSDRAVVSGDLVLSSPTTTTFRLQNTGAGAENNRYYYLISYTGALTGSVADIALDNQTGITLAALDVISASGVNYVRLGLGDNPTPVRVAEFVAQGAGGGALLKWTCGSELENAGFHVWRRVAGEGEEGWTRRSEALIPGGLTTGGPTQYAWYDPCDGGTYECRLESVSTRGAGEFYGKLAELTVEGGGELAAPDEKASEVVRAAYEEYRQRGARAARVAELQRAAAGAARRVGQVTALARKPVRVGWCGGESPRSVLASAPVWSGVSELLLGVKAAEALAAGTELAWLPPVPRGRLGDEPAQARAEQLGAWLRAEPGALEFPFRPRTAAGGTAVAASIAAAAKAPSTPGGPPLKAGGGVMSVDTPAGNAPPLALASPLSAGGVAVPLAAAARPVSGALARPGPVAKVVYRGSGLLRVPDSSLPPGFDASRVTAEREGEAVSILARTSDGLLLYGPGYEDEYTDEDVYFLRPTRRATGVGAAPYGRAGRNRGAAAEQVTEATTTVRFHEVYYDWYTWRVGYYYDYEPWFSKQYLTSGSTATYTVECPGATGAGGRVAVKLWSFSDLPTVAPDHQLRASVNGQAAGEVSWDGGHKALTVSFDIPAGVLKDGANTVELYTVPLAGNGWQLGLVYSVSVTYARKLKGPGALEVAAQEGAAWEEASGLATKEVYVVDRTEASAAKLVEYEWYAEKDGTYTVRFVRRPGREYVLVPRGSEKEPLSVTLRYIEPLNGGAGYLAVGAGRFEGALKPLLEQRTKEGLAATFAEQERVFDAYGWGRYGPEGIRRAVRVVRPRYLLLVGSTKYDYRNYEGKTTDRGCPTFLAQTSMFSQVPGDPLFGDLGRGYPEVAVGRYPAKDESELGTAVGRTLSYTGRANESGRSGLMVADKPDPSAGDFAGEADGVVAGAVQWEWEKAYQGLEGKTADQVRAQIVAAAASGDVIAYVGHGSAAMLGKDRLVTTGTVGQWTGNVVVVMATCNGNYFLMDVATLARGLLFQGGGGAAATIGPATYVQSGPTTEVMGVLLGAARGGGRWGEAVLSGQRAAYGRSQGRAGLYDDLLKAETLLGDPALPVEQAAPQAAPASAPKTDTGTF